MDFRIPVFLFSSAGSSATKWENWISSMHIVLSQVKLCIILQVFFSRVLGVEKNLGLFSIRPLTVSPYSWSEPIGKGSDL